MINKTSTIRHLLFFTLILLLVSVRFHPKPPLPNNNTNSDSVRTRITNELGYGYNLQPNHKHMIKKVIYQIVLFISLTVVSAIFFYTLLSVLGKVDLNMLKAKEIDSGTIIFSPLIKPQELAFLEKDDEFSTMEPLGSGACGKVYLVELPQGRVKRIAIKKITRHPNDAIHMNEFRKKMKQVKSEIQTVGRLRHKNLLPLLAHVTRPNCDYLVYRFMKNGSLQDILRELDWPVRHKVALGVADGLEYIHISLTPRIVHRDLKPANILLDDNMKAYISDFGLAKSIPDTDTHMTASNVAGTTGYVAPEYAQFKIYTEKCDIFSFGVILAVLVSGKFPTDEFFDHSIAHMIKWIRRVMTMTDKTQAIDVKLMGNGYEEQMLKVLKIACHCTLKDPKQRPSSKDVRLMLAI